MKSTRRPKSLPKVLPRALDDPRHRNKIFSPKSAQDYLTGYRRAIQRTLGRVDSKTFESVAELLVGIARQGRRVFVGGNGGSASISDHLCCDWSKGTWTPGQRALHTHSLVGNTALFTALANDFGYENVFSLQLEMHARKGDALVLVSASGNSSNIVHAARTAKKMGVTLIGFTGFDGGALGRLADLHIHAPYDNYGVVEDCHQVLMHVLSQYLAAKLDRRRDKSVVLQTIEASPDAAAPASNPV